MPLLIGRDRTKEESSDEEIAMGLKDSYTDPNKYCCRTSTTNNPKHKKFGLFRKDSKKDSTFNRKSNRLSKN